MNGRVSVYSVGAAVTLAKAGGRETTRLNRICRDLLPMAEGQPSAHWRSRPV